MYKIIFSLIITLVILVTILISFLKPQMHKTVFVYDSSYEIVEAKKEVKTTKTMPTTTSKPEQVKTVKSTVNNTATEKKQATTQKTIATTPKKTTTVKQQRVVSTNTPIKQTVKVEKKEPVKVTKQVQQTPKVATKTISETEKIRQETILWNKWRSDLQNKIMSDTKLPIVPQGTIFKFSFDVDKYGKITNLQTWSTNPTYTPYAIQYIAPVIKSYQGRSILNFPAGSNRISTSVDGGWKISTTSKYSTSNDYNDAERISK